MYKKVYKRIFDLVLASIIAVVTLPLQLTVGLLVKKKLGSPVLFRQERPGKDGATFELIKFRSMTDERDEAGELLPPQKRLTEFGKKLRSTSLDELPEVYNVIRGDMSLVGPRPLLVKYLSRYNAFQARRHEVRPGLTGLAQVSGRNSTTWEDRFNLDIEYVDNCSLGLDIRILFRTIKTVFSRHGVSASENETMPEFMGNPEEIENLAS